MKTKADYLAANARLATALGWTNIVDVGGALLGKPDWVCDNSRDQVQVPDWCGQWSACGPLLAQLQLWTMPADGVAMVSFMAGESIGANVEEWYRRHISPDHALRYAIVHASTIALEMKS